ncbi:alpha/beta hydrolase [Streptomyces sp. NPDC126497]|uniref:alpha/beta fold hydrolase n=1 Tax=Streptomyces sp. NPDC126497 TaxID=3155313 RepID=UPI00331A4DAA
MARRVVQDAHVAVEASCGTAARYRNMDRDWEDLAALDGAPVTQPSLFVGGGLDASTTWPAGAIEAYPVTLPGLVSSHVLDGCGHWIQQERPDEVNRLLTEWPAAL